MWYILNLLEKEEEFKMFFWLLITSIAILIGSKTFYYYIEFVIYLITSLYVAKILLIIGNIPTIFLYSKLKQEKN